MEELQYQESQSWSVWGGGIKKGATVVHGWLFIIFGGPERGERSEIFVNVSGENKGKG